MLKCKLVCGDESDILTIDGEDFGEIKKVDVSEVLEFLSNKGVLKYEVEYEG